MEIFLTCCLALLEVTFVFVGLLLLHSLRKIVFGNAAFYIAIGLLLIFTQLVSATELKVIIGYPGMDFYIAQSVLFLPYLAIILIVYVTEGTLTTQRFIIGAMVTLGFYIYLSHLTAIQCGWSGYTISQGPSADSLEYLLKYSQRTMASSILAQTLDLFLIPIFFQRLKNMNCRLFICVLGALMLTQLVDTFVYVTACYWADPQWWMHIKSSYIVKAFLTIWLSFIATIYLSRIENERPGHDRGALDILISFLGSYGRAQALQKNLQEWEGRYRVVVESSSDIILLLDREGKILDANNTAAQIMKSPSRNDLIGKNFNTIVADKDEFPFDMDMIWANLDEERNENDDSLPDPKSGQNLELKISATDGEKIEINAFVNSIRAENIPLLIIFGRDVTEQNRLQREKEELREQLGHAQRLESVGKLAGGVAHDFNNYIHSIQGNLDILLYMHKIDDEKIVKHLNRINDIADQAAKLTQQLLGFARKGKYNTEIISITEILTGTLQLFSPQSLKNIVVKTDFPKEKLFVKGDAVQLKQVFLNILINARDAIESQNSGQGEIMVKAGRAESVTGKFEDATVGKFPAPCHSYFYVLIRDSGTGIDKDIINRIFDPFFTTKPVGKGTGMGLAMVYGAITNHHGFVYADSEINMGTEFYVFLPENKEHI